MRHLTAGRRTSPYLQGNYAPVDKEIVATNLLVQGILPAGLVGRYYRTGSNPSKSFEGRPYHWFDGDGMTHAVTFETDGTVTYRNAWVRTHRFHRAALEGKSLAPIGESMRGNPTVMMEVMEEDASDGESFGLMHGTGNTAMLSHAGRIYALHEGDFRAVLAFLVHAWQPDNDPYETTSLSSATHTDETASLSSSKHSMAVHTSGSMDGSDDDLCEDLDDDREESSAFQGSMPFFAPDGMGVSAWERNNFGPRTVGLGPL